ncbi:MAG: UpxY family transcription antiterminator [Candidatus Solibacter sp.]
MAPGPGSSVGRQSDSHLWFALKTRVGDEQSVNDLLSFKGFEAFLPLYQLRKKWSDRYKTVNLPYFPGYVFCSFDPRFRLPVLTTPGVQFVVGYGKQLVSIEDREIDAIRKVVSSGVPATTCTFLSVGEKVRITEGSLCGAEGLLVRLKSSWRVVLSVTLLQRSIYVEVDQSAVELIAQQPLRQLRAAG